MIEKPAKPVVLPSMRIDVWLCATRFFKTRALAKAAIEGGKVRVNALAAKPAKLIHVGDLVRTVRGDEIWEIQVLTLQAARANPAIAATLYLELPENTARRLLEREKMRLHRLSYSAPESKPDKQARRKITRFERAVFGDSQ